MRKLFAILAVLGLIVIALVVGKDYLVPSTETLLTDGRVIFDAWQQKRISSIETKKSLRTIESLTTVPKTDPLFETVQGAIKALKPAADELRVLRAAEIQRVAHEKEEKSRRERPQLACYAAQHVIRERLASAAQAKFPSCIQYPGHVTTEAPDRRWIVHSWVELPDPSGIYRQRGFTVAVDYLPETRQFRTFIMRLN